jgi:hypothetical protein
MVKKILKKMSSEERKEFKGGKYMGGPAEEKAEKKKKPAKRMAMGGLGMDDSDMRPPQMPGRGMGREMEDNDMEDGMDRGRERGMERRMQRGREREMERGMDRGMKSGMDGSMERYGRGPVGVNPQAMRRPKIGSGLPPAQNMGPGNMPPAKMPGAPGTGLTQSAALGQNAAQLPSNQNMLRSMQTAAQPPVSQSMLNSMAPNKMAPSMGPMKMRGGGIARKGKGLTMAKGGLVKGAGCVSKGMKKPRMM